MRGASFDKKEFKRNLAGSVSYPPVYTVDLDSAIRVCVSTQTRNLPVPEMGDPFPVLVPLLELKNPISGTALNVRFLRFLALFSHERDWVKTKRG